MKDSELEVIRQRQQKRWIYTEIDGNFREARSDIDALLAELDLLRAKCQRLQGFHDNHVQSQ